MQKNGTIHERIELLVDKFGNGKNTVFATLIQSNEANVRGYIKKGVMPKYDILESIVRNLEINPEWLLTGKGEMLKNSDIQGGTSPMCAQPAAQEQDTTTALLKEQLREKDNEIKALNREIGRLQAENELLYKKTATITSTPTLQPKKKTQGE